MQEPLYKVVFNGVLTGEYDEITARKQFARLFNLDERKLKALFSGREFVIKSNVSEEVAMKFAVAIAEVGCESTVEPVDASLDAVRELPFPDRRKRVRRIWFRRGPRRRAEKDRRQVPGRRSVDLLMSSVRQVN